MSTSKRAIYVLYTTYSVLFQTRTIFLIMTRTPPPSPCVRPSRPPCLHSGETGALHLANQPCQPFRLSLPPKTRLWTGRANVLPSNQFMVIFFSSPASTFRSSTSRQRLLEFLQPFSRLRLGEACCQQSCNEFNRRRRPLVHHQ